MNTATIAGIILATAGALIVGMAALIKTMLIGKIATLQESMTEIINDMKEVDRRLTEGNALLVGDIHAIDLRLKTLEVEHKIKSEMGACHHTCKD